MGFSPIANTAKVAIEGHNGLTLVPIANILHASCGSSPTQTYLQTMADAVRDAVVLDLNTWPSDYTCDQVVVTDLNTATGPQAVSSSGPIAGTGDTMNATQACGLVKHTTAKRGRSYRGRSYLPIPADTLLTGGLLDATIIDRLDDLFENIQTKLAGLSPASELVIGSRKLGTSEAITLSKTETTTATQRRRVGR